MKEIEVKILDIDRKEVEERLTSLGAKKILDSDIQTIFFDFQDGKIIKAKDVLRLRREDNKVELTYKKVHTTQTAKEAEEYSVDVSNIEEMRKILENLGLHETENMLKHRISYKLDNARFDMDHYLEAYSFIPEFMEIEAENTELIDHYAELLGFKPKDCLPWSTYDIIQYYSSKKEKVSEG
ncbi:MAG: class IV adenylate cyclase [Candidatus Bathyarchaeia archaeon]|jgi:adenylate cyclase class 2